MKTLTNRTQFFWVILLQLGVILMACCVLHQLNKHSDCIYIRNEEYSEDKNMNINNDDDDDYGNTSYNSESDNNNHNKDDINININIKDEHIISVKKDLLNEKPSILLFVGIMSAPSRILRRNALRRTWLSKCNDQSAVCWIFTDGQDMHGKRLSEEIYLPLKQEQYIHGDLILAESPGGINFARRYLWMIEWADERYNFEFFLRVDDDYFICMDRLLLELPQRPREKLYWGHVHCYPPGGIRVDEGFVIVTNDLVQEFLWEKNNSLMCHAFGDQAMVMWINNIPGVTYFGDPRVYNPVSADQPILLRLNDSCRTFLALHGSYPVQMEKLWINHVSAPTQDYTLPGISYPCGNQNKMYNHSSFEGMYYAEPVPCRESPIWTIGNFYQGRSGF